MADADLWLTPTMIETIESLRSEALAVSDDEVAAAGLLIAAAYGCLIPTMPPARAILVLQEGVDLAREATSRNIN
jgi:hypothetical protein